MLNIGILFVKYLMVFRLIFVLLGLYGFGEIIKKSGFSILILESVILLFFFIRSLCFSLFKYCIKLNVKEL